MSKLVWDAIGEKLYESGVDHGVLYPISSGAYPKGVVWNGLTSVSESPEGGDENAFYADNIKYGSLRGTEDFGGTIEAYTYPKEWEECDGSKEVAPGVVIGQQNRKTFGLSYRTLIGNDEDNLDHGYKLHLVWGATASPSEKQYQTINDSPEAITFSWEFKTVPVPVKGWKPISQMTIDSTKTDAAKLTALEEELYGSDNKEARLPLPDEVVAMMTGTDPTPTPTVEYEPVLAPTGNPSEQGYYELIDGEYVLSEDTEVDPSKTYYVVKS